jgi:hypothetical protein
MSVGTTINNTANMTIDSIEQVVKAYKVASERTDDYGVGYDDALDQVLRSLAMYRKIVNVKHEELKLSE